jgi:tellurite resistance protein
MQSYSCAIIGIEHERRSRYIARQVHAGGALALRREQDEAAGGEAIAVYHERRKIGFIPPEEGWAVELIESGAAYEASVKDLARTEEGAVAGITITVTVGEKPQVAAPEPNPVVAAIGDELKILGAVAKAGGRFSRAERDLIAKYAEVRCGELSIGAATEEIAASLRWLKHNIPDDHGLASAVGRLRQPDAFDAMLEVSEIIAEADGSLGTEEEAAVARIRSLIAERRTSASP